MSDDLAPPDDLDPEWAAEWRELYGRLVEQKTFTPTDRPILDRLIENRRDAADYRRRLKAAEPLVETRHGMEPHPLIKMVRDIERDIRNDEVSLMADPRTRNQQRLKHAENREVGIDDFLGGSERDT